MISETDLILKGNNIYHLDVNKENIAETIILVGDQDRVPMISKYFDRITHKSQHREFVVHSGYIGSKYLSVISTGIGCDNIDIVINELDAIFNIDLKTREIKKDLTSLNLIRLGTCGTIKEDIPVDSIIVSDYGLGMDNLLSFYKGGQEFYRNAYDDLTSTYPGASRGCRSIITNHNCYLTECDRTLSNLFNDYIHGITATFPGFYGPQSRSLRLKIDNSKNLYNHENKRFHDIVHSFFYTSHRKDNSEVINFEMETSALYGLAKLSGHKALTLCTVVANRVTKEFTKNGEKSVDNLIKKFLERIV